MNINEIKSSCIQIAKEYRHEFVVLDHLMVFLLKNDEVVSMLDSFATPTEQILESTFAKLKEIQGESSDTDIQVGTDVRRAFQKCITLRGSSINVTVLDVLYGAVDVIRENESDGDNESILSKAISVNELEAGLRKLVSGEKTSNKHDHVTEKSADQDLLFNELKPNATHLIGCEDELAVITHALGQSKNSIAVISGESYTGKSSLIQEVVNSASYRDKFIPIAGLKFISLNISRAVANKHDIDKHINSVIRIAKADNAVLVIDDCEILAPSNNDQSIGILIQRAARDGLKVLCSTTPAGFTKVFEKKGPVDSITRVNLKEHSLEDVIEILNEELDYMIGEHNLVPASTIVMDCINMAKEHLKGQLLLNSARVLSRAISIVLTAGGKNVDTSHTVDAACELKGVSKNSLSLENNRIIDLPERLKLNVFGQDEAIDAISKGVRAAKMGFKELPNRPNGCFMMLGPTGTGKTELSLQLGKELNTEVIRLDMSEYQESHTVSKLLGAPAGYAGHNDGDGCLYEKIKQTSDAIVLFDEIEKAHPSIYRLLLGAMDHGVLVTSTNKKIIFKDTFILFTTNIGVDTEVGGGFGFNAHDQMDKVTIDDGAYESTFSSEFRNRIDRKITFKTLSKDSAARVAKKVSERVAESLMNAHGIKMEVSESAIELLVQRHFSVSEGARAISRGFQDDISVMIMDALVKIKKENKPIPKCATVNEGEEEFTLSFS